MKKPLILLAGVFSILLVVFGVLLIPKVLYAREVKRAVVAYDAALSAALSARNPELLANVTTQREMTRVTSYITLLWGQQTQLDSTLTGIKLGRVTSSEPTVTVVAHENWRYQERDAKTGKAKGTVTNQAQVIRYTLLRGQDGALRVYLSEAIRSDDR